MRWISFQLVLAWAVEASAEEMPNADVEWQRALVVRARDGASVDRLLRDACEAGSSGACMETATAAVEAGDLDGAEEWLRLGIGARPDDVSVRLALATVMAARGNIVWAARELQRLEAAGEDVAFELGYCMYRLEMHEQAAERLEAAAAEDDHASLAALYGAASMQAVGRTEDAERLARIAALDRGDPRIAEVAEDLLESLALARARQRVAVTAVGSVSAGFDSNPVLGPDDAPVHGAGERLWLRAAVAGEPIGGAWWALGGRAVASRDQSFEEDARPFDFTALQAGPHARLLFGVDVPQEISLAYRLHVGLLDGGEGVEERDLYAYSESHTGAVTYSLDLLPGTTTRFRVESGWTTYHDRARSGLPLGGAVGESLLLLGGRLKCYVELGARRAWARSPQYDLVGGVASLAVSYLTSLWEIELLGGGSYSRAFYLHSEGADLSFDYTRPNLRRHDATSRVFAEIGRSAFDGHVRIALRYELADSASSIPSYDYSRHRAELGVSGGF